MEKQINEKIIEIVHQANDMIPVEWDDLYINFEVDRTLSGGVTFSLNTMESTIIWDTLERKEIPKWRIRLGLLWRV